MKVPRSILGQPVKVMWRDPRSFDVDTHLLDKSELPKGEAALSLWTEYGLADDVTDGILRLLYSWSERADSDDDAGRFQGSLIPEDRIISISLLTAQPEST